MAINKVLFYDEVVMDITDTTAIENTVLEGMIFYKANGVRSVGALPQRQLECYVYDYVPGYTYGAEWKYENSTNNRTDIYQIVEGRKYVLSLGETVGTRFRSGYATTDPTSISSGSIKGTLVVNKTNPPVNDSVTFIASLTGYLYVTKDNTGVSGLKTWLFDITPA